MGNPGFLGHPGDSLGNSSDLPCAPVDAPETPWGPPVGPGIPHGTLGDPPEIAQESRATPRPPPELLYAVYLETVHHLGQGRRF